MQHVTVTVPGHYTLKEEERLTDKRVIISRVNALFINTRYTQP